jgi:hypothetical protein
MDYQKIVEDSVRIARDKGWLDKPRTYAQSTNLLHSEPSEALEDFRVHRGVNETFYEVEYEQHYQEEDGGGGWSGGAGKVTLSEAEFDEFATREGMTLKKVKPCGIPSEMADIIIRIAQECGVREWALPEAVTSMSLSVGGEVLSDFNESLARIHLAISKCFQACLSPEDDVAPVYYLAAAVKTVEAFCERNGIDLQKALNEKQAYNEKREFRHGNKAL